LKRISAGRTARILSGSAPETAITFLSFAELELAPEGPGWYCWIYCPDERESVRIGFPRHPSVDAKVDSVLGASYEGTLALRSEAALGPIEDAHFPHLQSAMLAFSPPLYIGISGGLRARLRTHSRQLEDSLHGARTPAGLRYAVQSDSDGESRYFGERVSAVMKEARISENCLYVKCVEAPSSDALRPVESILNRAYCPPFGRR
jgi:hypothetical protein